MREIIENACVEGGYIRPKQLIDAFSAAPHGSKKEKELLELEAQVMDEKLGAGKCWQGYYKFSSKKYRKQFGEKLASKVFPV